MKKILALLLIAATIFCLAGCKKNGTAKEPEITQNGFSYEEKGTGVNSFYLDITFEKDEKHYFIKTDKKTVGEALIDLEMIEGEQGDWGLYIFSVCGEEHKYESGGKYWAFFVDGQFAQKSVELTEIENGHTYALKVQ